MDLKWEEGYIIRVSAADGSAAVSANREGLRSLANHLAALADEAPGSHLHLDPYNGLEEGSAELLLEKTGEDGTPLPARPETPETGEAAFYGALKRYPLTLTERVKNVRLHEELGYHNETFLYIDIIGVGGKSMWQYPYGPISYPFERMRAIADYLCRLFSCPLEIRLYR